jgi:hypothetical protein
MAKITGTLREERYIQIFMKFDMSIFLKSVEKIKF